MNLRPDPTFHPTAQMAMDAPAETVAFTLMLFIGDAYEKLLSLSEGTWRHFSSPLWLIVDGAIAGLIISWIVHRRVGD